MAAIVRIPTPLRRLTGGVSEIPCGGGTVGALLQELSGQYPGLAERIYEDGGEVRRFINVYVNGEDVRFLSGLDTPVQDKDEVSIVPAMAGGS